jgi:hypothetical protein
MTIKEIRTVIDYLLSMAPTSRRVSKDQFNSSMVAVMTAMYQSYVEQVELKAKESGKSIHEMWFSVSSLVRYRAHAVLSATDALGFTSLPTDYAHYSSFTSKDFGHIQSLDVVSDFEIQERRASVLKDDMLSSPCAVVYNGMLRVYPYSAGNNGGGLECVYLRFFVKPYYDVCYNNSIGAIFMPEGHYIRRRPSSSMVYDLFDDAGVLVASDVEHPNVIKGTTSSYTSATKELDLDERFHTVFLEQLASLLNLPYNDKGSANRGNQ